MTTYNTNLGKTKENVQNTVSI